MSVAFCRTKLFQNSYSHRIPKLWNNPHPHPPPPPPPVVLVLPILYLILSLSIRPYLLQMRSSLQLHVTFAICVNLIFRLASDELWEILYSYINNIISLPAPLLCCVFDRFVLLHKIPNICRFYRYFFMLFRWFFLS